MILCTEQGAFNSEGKYWQRIVVTIDILSENGDDAVEIERLNSIIFKNIYIIIPVDKLIAESRDKSQKRDS